MTSVPEVHRTIKLKIYVEKAGRLGLSLTYTLVHECLKNEGAAMPWQIEEGKVMEDNRHVADYWKAKQVSCITNDPNTPMLVVTLVSWYEKPPEDFSADEVPNQSNLS